VSIYFGVQAMECVRKLKTTGLPSGNTVVLSAAIRALGPYASPSAEQRQSCTYPHVPTRTHTYPHVATHTHSHFMHT
jgi:hypothetical protein